MNTHNEHIAKGNTGEIFDSILFFIVLFIFISTIGIVFYAAV